MTSAGEEATAVASAAALTLEDTVSCMLCSCEDSALQLLRKREDSTLQQPMLILQHSSMLIRLDSLSALECIAGKLGSLYALEYIAGKLDSLSALEYIAGKLGSLYALEYKLKFPRCYAVAAAHLGLIPCIEVAKTAMLASHASFQVDNLELKKLCRCSLNTGSMG